MIAPRWAPLMRRLGTSATCRGHPPARAARAPRRATPLGVLWRRRGRPCVVVFGRFVDLALPARAKHMGHAQRGSFLHDCGG
eukprot:3573798-Alexandrium_andersonii.AAC.2